MSSIESEKLCRTASGTDALVYKLNSEDDAKLVYKVDKTISAQKCTISINYGNQSWTCDTFHCYHTIEYSSSGSFSSGSGSIVSTNEKYNGIVYSVEPSSTTASIFTIDITVTTYCGAIEKEKPEADFSVYAMQSVRTPQSKAGVVIQFTEGHPKTVSIKVSFDKNGNLTGIE